MTTPPQGIAEDLCRRCRKGHVVLVAVGGVYPHEGETIVFPDEFMRCDNCGHEFYTTEQSMAKSRAITSAIRKKQGLLTGEEIRAARLYHGLSLSDFERALGVGQKTVGRWERNTVPPTGAANFGLWVAANEPEVFRKWAKQRGVVVKKTTQRAVSVETSTSQAPTLPKLSVVIGGLANAPRTASTNASITPQKQEGVLSLVGESV